jgi:hypothetical protein
MNQPYVPIKDNKKFIQILNEETKKKKSMKKETGQNCINTLIY